MQRYLVLDYPPTRVIGDVTAGSARQAARIADEDNDALGFEYDVQESACADTCRVVFEAPGSLLDDSDLAPARALAGHLPVACFVARRRMALSGSGDGCRSR